MAKEKITLEVEVKGNAAEQMEQAAQGAMSLRQELKQLTLELQNLEPGSARFQELTQRAGELKDQIADTNAVINATAGSGVENLAKGFTGVATTGIAAFQGIQSAQALFGVESEELTQTLVKLQALAGLSDALQSLGALGDTMAMVKASFTAAATQLGIFTVAKEADVVATGAQAVATEGATVAQTGLNVAMLANPVFLLVAGIAALVGAFIMFSGKSKEAEEQEKKRKAAIEAAEKAQKAEAEAVAKSSTEFVGLIYQLKDTNINSKERSQLMGEINSKYGLTLQNLKDERSFQEQLNGVVEEYITVQRNKYKLQKNEEYFQSALAKQEKAYSDLHKAQKSMVDGTGFYMNKQGQFVDKESKRVYTLEQMLHGFNRANGTFFGGFGAYTGTIKKFQNEAEKAQTSMEKLSKRHAELVGKQNELTDDGKKYEDQEEANRKAEERRQKSIDAKNKKIEEAKEKQKAYNDALTAYYDLLEKNRQSELTGRDKALQELANQYDEQIAIADKAGKDTTEITALYLRNQKKVNDEFDTKEKEEKDKKDKEAADKKKAQGDLLFSLTKTEMENEIKAVEDAAKEKEKVADGDAETLIAISEDTEDKIQKIKDKYRKIDEEKQAAEVQKRADTFTNLATIIRDLRADESGWLNDLVTTGLDAISKFTLIANKEFESVLEKVNAYTQAIGGVLQGVVGAFQEKSKENLENTLSNISEQTTAEQDALQAKYDAGLIAKEEYETGLDNIDKAAKAKEQAARKKAFEQEKGAKIASAIISGIQGAVQAFTGAMSLGPIAGPIVGGVLAALVVAMTATNVAKIKATQFDAGGGGGGGGATTPTMGTDTGAGVAPTPSSLSIQGGAMGGSEGAGSQLYGSRQTPVRSYVVESDITGTQDRLQSYQQRAEIG